ncbi:DUF3179 domain-containing protein [archaeon]|jgi:hypothetical protein|nr:DUF3179 domain-containing protein [archaeon]MBT6698375.1 DUF3179 domain-containing protein [archaeon]
MKKKLITIVLFLAALFLLVSCIDSTTSTKEEANTQNQEATNAPETSSGQETSEVANPISEDIQYTEDGTPYIIHPDDILSGGPRKGGIGVDQGIPALSKQNIDFVTVEEANTYIQDNELVLALHYKGEKRVYPLQIMVWHEIANDVVAGDPILITYCPLCGSGIAYKREMTITNEQTNISETITPKFGTSGKLYNSNLVMYDDKTDTYWQQIDGKAIIGQLTGQELEDINIDTVVWRDYKAVHQDAMVLSQETGMSRSYGTDPYGSYYENSLLFFPVDNEIEDESIHPKTVIYGIQIDNTYKAYIEDDIISAGGSITDSVGSVNMKITREADGIVTIINSKTSEELVKERDFFFAWYAFHPDTLVYGR